MTAVLLVISFVLILLVISLSNKIDILTNQFNSMKTETDKQIKHLSNKLIHIEQQLNNPENPKTVTKAEPQQEIKPTTIQPVKPKTIEPPVTPHIVADTVTPHVTPEPSATPHIVPEPTHHPQPSVSHAEINDINISKNVYEKSIREKHTSDFENLFIGNIFSKIGGIALVIAICFLVKFSSNYIEFTPQLNITLGYLVSVIFLGVSLYMQDKKPKVTSEILSGVSIAGFLLSTYFGCFYYSLFPVTTALILAFVTAIISYIIAEKFDSFATIAIGLFGGYLNPAVFNADITINLMFGYLIALNLISLAYTYKNGSKNIINIFNIVLTLGVIGIFSSRGEVSIGYPIALWLLYVVYDILTILTGVKQEETKLIRWFNFAALFFMVNHIFRYTNFNSIGLTVLGIGIVYAVIYSCFRKSNDEISVMSLQSSLICLFFATFYLVKLPYLGLAWAIEGYLVSELYLKHNNYLLQKYVFLFFCPSLIYLLVNYNKMFINNEQYSPVVISLIFLAQAAIALYSSYRVKKNDLFLATNLKMIGYSTIYLYILFFVNSKETFNHSKMFINSIISAIYSLHSYKILSEEYKDFANIFSYILYVISLTLLLIAECLTFNNVDFVPFFNIKFATYLTIIALTIYFAKKRDVLFEYIAVVIGLFSLVSQIMCIFKNIIPEATMPLIITTILIIYAGTVLTIGIIKDIASMKQTSVCLILILLSKLILIDLNNIDALFKLLAFVIIGFILLGISSYYQKRK